VGGICGGVFGAPRYGFDVSEKKEERSVGRSIVMLVLMAISVAYLMNPTAGMVELIPDIVPGIGNLDEAGATALLIACLGYFGFDISRMFKRRKEEAAETKDAKVTKVSDAGPE
jgi:uncharacterized membrane protein YkvA (DUF1232 family)